LVGVPTHKMASEQKTAPRQARGGCPAQPTGRQAQRNQVAFVQRTSANQRKIIPEREQGTLDARDQKINKVEDPSSLPKLPNQNYLPVVGMAFQELMPRF
jgi:hypothetical protein